MLDFNDQNLPIESLGYTEEEFRRMIKDENPFILNVLKDGVVLYDVCLV